MDVPERAAVIERLFQRRAIGCVTDEDETPIPPRARDTVLDPRVKDVLAAVAPSTSSCRRTIQPTAGRHRLRARWTLYHRKAFNAHSGGLVSRVQPDRRKINMSEDDEVRYSAALDARRLWHCRCTSRIPISK